VLVPVYCHLGINGPPQLLGETEINGPGIGNVSAWAGSSHILSMGRHFHDYIEKVDMPPLPSSSIPAILAPLQLGTKLRAPAVTGNIGEGVAAAVARTLLGLGVPDIILVKPSGGKRKSPDFLMKLTTELSSVWIEHVNPRRIPDWWPVEAKTRARHNQWRRGATKALQQLAVHWQWALGSTPPVTGFGLICVYSYEAAPRIRLVVCVPQKLGKLRTQLKAAKALNTGELRSTLYGW